MASTVAAADILHTAISHGAGCSLSIVNATNVFSETIIQYLCKTCCSKLVGFHVLPIIL